MYQNMFRIITGLVLLTIFSACHDHPVQENGHGHEHAGTSVTQWNDKTEIFMEYPALVIKEEAAFIIHLSRMKDFKPVTEGMLTCIFQGDNGERFEVMEKAPASPGIFRPVISFSQAGLYEMELRLNSPQVSDTIRVSGVKVHADPFSLPHEEDGEDGYISYLKEQQWKIDFRTEPAQFRQLSGSVQAAGELLPKTQGNAAVPAPANGLILAEKNALIPSLGTWVRRGKVLAVISPSASGDNSLNNIQSDYLLAKSEYERAQRLYDKKAISQKRLEETRLRFDAKKAGYDVIAEQINFSDIGNTGNLPTANFYLTAPIDGFIEEINFHPGEAVTAGQQLFKIANPKKLLLKVNVPESRIGQVQFVSNAAFQVAGYEQEFVISDLNGKLVSISSMVSAGSRTVPIYFEFHNPGNSLKIGAFAEVSLKIGEPENTLGIPQSAILDEDGTAVTYVHVEGESFEKRILKTGITDRGYTQILSGISEGERVVTVGGYQVRLASMSTSVPTGHGHEH